MNTEIKDENIVIPEKELEQIALSNIPPANEERPNISFYLVEWTIYLGIILGVIYVVLSILG